MKLSGASGRIVACVTSRRGTCGMAAVEATGLVKTFKTRKDTVKALDGIDLEIPEGSVLGLARAERRR
jgi:hypothetical protein